MPTVQRFARCIVKVNIRDHLPPHFHIVMNDGRDALVEIETLAITGSRIRRSELAEALEWAARNKPLLRAKFKECNT